jgi:myo-inositol-1(or 4)-monophosphatase
MERKKELKVAIEASKKAAKTIMQFYQKSLFIKKKSNLPREIVSQVDLIVEKEIKSIINLNFKKHSTLGEESGFENKKSDYIWIIDPIDGTVNYTRGLNNFCISIALEYKKKIILGVVYNPKTDECYYAVKKGGAFLNGNKIVVSKNKTIQDSLMVCAFSSNKNKILKKEYEVYGKLNNESQGVLRIGSAALSLCYLAKGSIDGFWGKNVKLWDVAAGCCIVNEAGGEILLSKLKNDYSNLIATNSFISSSLKTKLKSII